MNHTTHHLRYSRIFKENRTESEFLADENLSGLLAVCYRNNSDCSLLAAPASSDTNTITQTHFSLCETLIQVMDVSKWKLADVVAWLQRVELGQYVDAFTAAVVDGPALLKLEKVCVYDQ